MNLNYFLKLKMKEETLTTESTNRRKSTSSIPSFTYDYKYSFLNKDQTRNLNFKTKKIIEKYTYHDNSNENLKDEYNLHLSGESKDNLQAYNKFIYKKGDNYETLINKNKNLKRLFEQANCSLILSLQKQEKIEKKYEDEKKEILEKLSKIQKNYELYAESYKQLNNFKSKINEITNSYNQLMTLYLKLNSELKHYNDKISSIFNDLNTFIENYYENESVNLLSFEFILHIKNEIKDRFNLKESEKVKNQEFRNFEKEIINNKLRAYYGKKSHNNNFTRRNDKIKNRFNKSENISLITKIFD